MNTNEKVALAAVGGSAAGAGLVFGLREVDKSMAKDFLTQKATNASATPPLLMKQIGNFGSPSVIGGIGFGLAGIGLGLYGAHRGKYLKTPTSQIAVASFGGSALATGIISGVMPTSEWSSAVATDPSNGIGFNRAATLNIATRQPMKPSYVSTA